MAYGSIIVVLPREIYETLGDNGKDEKHTTRGEKRAKNHAKRPKTASNDVFTFYIRQKLGVECVREYRFHPSRMWRFDYAIPSLRIAIEIDGGIWITGRHNRASGYLGDMEKFNAAATLGWVVLKFTPQEQYTRKALDLITATVAYASQAHNPFSMEEEFNRLVNNITNKKTE